MARLQLESATDILDLDGIRRDGRGVQVQPGVTGLGLPPKQVQWLEGAGDGAIARGRRVLPRDIDLPLFIQGSNRTDLKAWLSRLALVLAGTATLRLIEDDESTSWFTEVQHVGGGGYVYGVDTIGETDFQTVITLRAGDPYFTSSVPREVTIGSSPSSRGLLGTGGLIKLSVSSSQAIGEMLMENTGDAPAYPIWHVTGPGTNFKAIAPTGETLHWEGTLDAGEALWVDTKAGTIVDNEGANVYAELAPAPRFWAIPPGRSTCTASLDDIVPGTSKITVSYRPRRWLVI